MASMLKKSVSDAPPLPLIGQYQVVTSFNIANNAEWAFAVRDGKDYFLKRFSAPTYPALDSGIGEELIAKKREQGDLFYARKSRLYGKVSASNTAGHIICPEALFLFGTKFYAVSQKVDIAPLTIRQIAAQPDSLKMVLLRALAVSMRDLHANGVVHADIKPDNIMIKKMLSGYLIAKVIDFDSSFLVTDSPRSWKDVAGDLVYLAPETCLAICGDAVTLDEKLDVFALGLLFHEYWTGTLPYYPDRYAYAHNAVLDGVALQVDKRIPADLAAILSGMLEKEPGDRPSMQGVFDSLSAIAAKDTVPSDPLPPAATPSASPTVNPWKKPVGFD